MRAVSDALGELVERRCNTVISGATSSGKTSLMSSLLGLVRPGERIVLLEDTAELAPLADHVVRLEARPGSNDGLPRDHASSNSCTRPCGCGPTASSSARSAAARSSVSSRH